MTRTFPRPVAAIVLSLILISGCGDKKPDTNTSTTTTASPVSAPVPDGSG